MLKVKIGDINGKYIAFLGEEVLLATSNDTLLDEFIEQIEQYVGASTGDSVLCVFDRELSASNAWYTRIHEQRNGFYVTYAGDTFYSMPSETKEEFSKRVYNRIMEDYGKKVFLM